MRDRVNVQALIEEFGLPEDAKYLGYVVHLPVEDEFLHSLQETKDAVLKKFTPTPELAKVFFSKRKASIAARRLKQQTNVCYLFDIGNQLVIAA